MAAWPPDMNDLLLDMKLNGVVLDADSTAQLTQVLDAAIAYVERVRDDLALTDGAIVSKDLILGTVRYARRLDLRRESPVGMIVIDGMASANIPGWDADTEKLLGIGRYAKPRFA